METVRFVSGLVLRLPIPLSIQRGEDDMAVSGDIPGRRDSGFFVREYLEGREEKRSHLGGKKFFFLDREFLWCHEVLFD